MRNESLQPIFHCDAKYLASGVGVGQCPRRHNFALEIPTCWYILALPNAKICVTPDANPRRQSVEYRWRWAFWHWGWRWACTFHIFCVDFICVWWSMQTQYPVEYGLTLVIPRQAPNPDNKNSSGSTFLVISERCLFYLLGNGQFQFTGKTGHAICIYR